MRPHISNTSSTPRFRTTEALTPDAPAGSQPNTSGRSGRRLNGVVVALAALLIILIASAIGIATHLLARERQHTAGANSGSRSDPAAAAAPAYPTRAWLDNSPAAPKVGDTPRQANQPDDVDPILFPGGLPNPNLTPQQAAKIEADRNLKQIEKTGSASGELSAAGLKVLERWKALPSMSRAEFVDFRCFKGGCSVVSAHQDLATAQSAGEELLRSAESRHWPGRKFRSGPLETPSGTVQFVWIFYSVDGDNATAQTSKEQP